MIRTLTLAAFLICSGATLLPAPAQTFTLQQVMSAPFNSDLHASPKGSRIVWVASQEGKRNLWTAELNGSSSAKQLTNYTADDGQDLSDIAWTPDGRSVVYVHGGDFEFPGRPDPNPALIASGVEQTIFIVPIDGGQPRRLAAGRSPSVSPDGKTLTFLHKDGIWSLPLSENDPKPEQIFHARGELGPPLWSPDGRYIAFTSDRGDHGFIGVYSVSEKTIIYLDPSTETDQYPEWSPDSRQIAFIRIAGESRHPGAHRTGEPWSIHTADVTTGAGHEIWRAAKGQGSVFHALATEDHQLFWTPGGHLIFASELDGWLHLYSVAANGGTATLLTPGDFEIEHVATSPDRANLVFSSNQGDIDRRHVWQIAADGHAAPRQLTKGDGIEVHPVITDGGAVAVLRSDARVPVRPALVSTNGELRDLAPQLVPADYPANKLVVPQQVILSAADGMKIHGQLFLPATANDGKRHPALVFFHGGSRRQMLLGYHYMGYYSNAYAMNQYLASLGYIVLSVNYRSGIGYGLSFREALNYGISGASEYNDVQGAGLYLRSRSDVDPARIGAWGGSYGGYLTALALARSSDLFAAGVDFHGVHDWSARFRSQSGENSVDPNIVRIAFESSPMASIKTWKSPVLLIQGDDDRNVAFSQTVRMAAALRAQGVEFEEHVFPDEIHSFLMHRSWLTAYGLTADFFGRHFNMPTSDRRSQ
ncbi:S9 family peptidase [Edaphobacter albus]|uniref:S9 family peptidase n=1 Tax=Edaphobacter sp. 4G125 TaxID=2763071 RepID=UPI00164707EE|nr:prolyl oligopeptidase family serine peptidase [Edaphobacter sp. 4G125]QNI36881.1 S9 family peptidase [Edaphobacter sp. 4G125]